MSTKKPYYIASGPAAVYLGRLSKAALIDILAEQLALASGSCDEPLTIEQVEAVALPVLNRRGDRAPRVEGGRE